jgi:uncharacterized membrane protein YfcA
LERQEITIGREGNTTLLSTSIIKTKTKTKNMKTFLINSAIYYVILSLVVGFVSLLTGIGGFIPMRIIMSLVLAYFRPLKEKW